MNRYRVCAEAGCPNYTDGHTRCDECRSAYERARGTRQQRGYDATHDRGRRQLIATNPTHCANCKRPFTDANPMQAGHATALRDGGTDNERLPHCRECNAGWKRTGL